MPGRDGTGPMGNGPATGRGLGPCGAGRGFRRFGFGRCVGFGPNRMIWTEAPANKTARKSALKERLAELEAERKEIEQELEE